jgi:hypothetical protein
MFRTRLAALFLTGGLTLISGCMTSGSMQLGCCNGCNGSGSGLGGLFSNLRGGNNNDCCCGSTMVGQLNSHAMSPDSVYVSPPTVVSPATTYPGPSVLPPRVVPVPTAPAVPYNPMP